MSEWISVKDRLPELDQKVLIVRGLYGDYKLAWLEVGQRYRGSFRLPDGRIVMWMGEDDFGYDATHWMPLPDPPPRPSTGSPSTAKESE